MITVHIQLAAEGKESSSEFTTYLGIYFFDIFFPPLVGHLSFHGLIIGTENKAKIMTPNELKPQSSTTQFLEKMLQNK